MSDKKLQNDITTERLREVIDKSRQTREKIAEGVDMDTSTVTKYYNGDRKLTAEAIKKFAVYFNVSADYLLGLSDAQTNDKDLQFVCDCTGLSAEAIKKIQGYCIPCLTSANDSNKCDEDIFLDNKYEIRNVNIYKQVIDNFILSDAFDGIASHGWNVQYINEAVLSYLALYFGDYEYFFELHDDGDTVNTIRLFLNGFEHDSIHGAFTDRIDMFSFKLQKSLLNYADKLFIFNKPEGANLEKVTDWIKYIVWSSVQQVYEENGNIDEIQEKIKQFMRDDYKETISKLKTIYEELKKGGINGNDN